MHSEFVTVTVRYTNGTHQTNTVRGMRASSTSDYRTAAQALAHKLFTGGAVSITRVEDGAQVAVQVFELREV